MKRFIAALTALSLIMLCGCESAEKHISDFSGFVKEKYEEVTEKAEQIGGKIISLFDEDYVDEYEVITVKPAKISDTGLLAYNRLNQKQKELYSILLSAISDMQTKKINITAYAGNDVFDDLSIAHRAILCDRPDIFWAPKTFSLLTFKNSKTAYVQFAKDGGKSYYGVTKTQKEKMQAELNAVLDSVLPNINAAGSVFEKELFIHDFICENVTYDDAAAADIKNTDIVPTSAYGVLVKGSAICEGYSKAFELLCNKAGIPCNVVYGEYDDTPHMWNIVDLDGALYYVDTTFDDGSSVSVLHTYFNVTKPDMLKDHSFYSQFPQNGKPDDVDLFNFYNEECESTELNYFYKKGLIITETCSEAVPAIIKEKQAGKKTAELKNITTRPIDDAFMHLRRKARRWIALDYYYRVENDDTVIAVLE